MPSTRSSVLLAMLLTSVIAPAAEQGSGSVDFTVVPGAKPESAPVGPDDWRLDTRYPGELIPRGGLPQVLARLEAGLPVTVAYLGGSITMAEDGWAGRTTRWLERRYPRSRIRSVNAGINGTGADFAAVRLGRHVLAEHPHLVFVEFVVNGGDGGVKDGLAKALEGIVRQIRAQDPATDIAFVHVFPEAHAASYRAEAPAPLPASAMQHLRVAEHYALPTIAFGPQIVALHGAGSLAFAGDKAPGKDVPVYTADGVHPTASGAQLCAGAVVRSLAALAKTGKPGPRALPPPLAADCWERTEFAGLEQVVTSGTWQTHVADPKGPAYAATFLDRGPNEAVLRLLCPWILATGSPGSSVRFRFQGTQVGILDVGGPFAGRIRVQVDDRPETVLDRFTRYSANLRHQYVFLPPVPAGEHGVVLTLDAQPPDKAAVRGARTDPAFARNEFLLGGILVVGKGVIPP